MYICHRYCTATVACLIFITALRLISHVDPVMTTGKLLTWRSRMSSRSAGSASVVGKPLPFNTSGRGRLSSPAVRKPYRLSYNFVQQCCAGRSHISGHIQSIALSHTTPISARVFSVGGGGLHGRVGCLQVLMSEHWFFCLCVCNRNNEPNHVVRTFTLFNPVDVSSKPRLQLSSYSHSGVSQPPMKPCPSHTRHNVKVSQDEILSPELPQCVWLGELDLYWEVLWVLKLSRKQHLIYLML